MLVYSKLLRFGSLAMLLSACGETATELTGGPDFAVSPLDGFVADLRGAGAKVERLGVASQSFIPVSGVELRVNEERLGAYELSTEAEVAMVASGISADGSTIHANGLVTSYLWIATPHFFRRDRLMVFYFGDSDETLELLTNILGAQFAGR